MPCPCERKEFYIDDYPLVIIYFSLAGKCACKEECIKTGECTCDTNCDLCSKTGMSFYKV